MREEGWSRRAEEEEGGLGGGEKSFFTQASVCSPKFFSFDPRRRKKKRGMDGMGWERQGRRIVVPSSSCPLLVSCCLFVARVRFAAFVPGPRDHSGHSYFIYSIFYSIPYFYSRYSLQWWRAALWIDPLDCLTNRPVGWFAPLHFFYDLIYCDMTWYGSVGATAKWPGDMIVERTVKEKERVAIS